MSELITTTNMVMNKPEAETEFAPFSTIAWHVILLKILQPWILININKFVFPFLDNDPLK